MPYKDIKEKIISRTIKLSPDYKHIIAHILHEFIDKEGDYKTFLLEHIEDIVNVFIAGESPNIRSLKCAIQDFYRVYKIFIEYNFTSELKKYLCSFLAFTLCCKEGNINKSSEYGYLLIDSSVEKKYPLYYHKWYMLYSLKDWVQNGEWNEQKVREEIEKHIEVKKEPIPEKIVRAYPISSLDEETIEKGLPVVIEDAYEGRLSINEYVTLLQNIALARQFTYDLPVEINIERINDGVNILLDRIIETDENYTNMRNRIYGEYKELLLPKELEIYDKICHFMDNNIQMFAISRRAYLSALSMTDTSSDMYQCENKRFNIFDKEMALAVANFYARLPNIERESFYYLFKKCGSVVMLLRIYKSLNQFWDLIC